MNRNLAKQLRILQYEVQRLKTKISLVEVREKEAKHSFIFLTTQKETNDKWGARYCRQVCLFANCTVGSFYISRVWFVF